MSAWSLLTWRGRGLLLLGFAIGLFALYRGQRDLLWLGLLLFLLPLGAILVVRGATLPVRVRREMMPSQSPVGHDVSVRLTLDKDHDLAGGLMLFEEIVPPELGSRPRFTIHQTAGHHRRELTYDLAGTRRGRYRVGPLRVEARDALGLVRLLRSSTETDELLITPRVYRLPPLRWLGGAADTGDATPQRLGVAGDDDVLVREYRHGDDMRRVHWRSTARYRELMVRREEQSWDPRAAIVIDSRAAAHAGVGEDSSFEWVVSAAASAATHFALRGYGIELVDASGDIVGAEGTHDHVVVTQRVLEHLTDIDLADSVSFTELVAGGRQLRTAQVVVALLGTTSGVEATRIAALRGPSGAAVAMLLDTGSFVDRPAPAAQREAELALTQAGWSCQPVAAGTDIEAAWRLLDGALA